MAAVKSGGNKSTERIFRAMLVSRGIKKWRMNVTELPGKPDFLFWKKKIAVFIDGCFWHGCPRCYRRPKSSIKYWDNKITQNVKRDRRNNQLLKAKGWIVLRIWEHELKSKKFMQKFIQILS